MNLNDLYAIILDRKKNRPTGSYTASLFKEGKDRIIKKVGEEATEVIIAAKNDNREELISEVADLWFHLLTLLAEYNIYPKEIFEELSKRSQKKLQNENG